ncbi:MAG: dUTP diphosphatase, partial [Jiangellaceae bacterium]
MDREVEGPVAVPVDVLVTRLDNTIPLPAYAHPGDAGADLVTTVDLTLGPGER